MTCGDCVYKKAVELVRRHKLDWIQALVFAEKAVERYEKRLGVRPPTVIKPCGCVKRSLHPHTHWFLGIPLSQLFHVNLRATIIWTLKNHALTWILGGFNPDYTRPCTIGGACVCNYVGQPCLNPGECTDFSACVCNCPAPSVPHSHQVSACSAAPDFGTATCACSGAPKTCKTYGACTCGGCAGTCGYSCDVGFVWNGVLCVAVGGAKNWLMDGYIFMEWTTGGAPPAPPMWDGWEALWEVIV
jgi:hypothetical protein